MKTLLILASVLMLTLPAVGPGRADVLLDQDFTSSSTVGDFVSATPDAGQFNDISAISGSTVSVANDQLVFDIQPGGLAGLLRVDLDNPAPSLLALEFVFTFDNKLAVNFGPSVTLQIGDYEPASNNYNSGGTTAQRFDQILFRRTGSDFRAELSSAQINDLVYGQEYAFLLLLNDSGAAEQYLGPDGVTRTLNDQSHALYIDGALAIDNAAAGVGGGSDLSGVRLRVVDGSDVDFLVNSIRVENVLPAVPEPASLALLGLGAGLMGVRGRP